MKQKKLSIDSKLHARRKCDIPGVYLSSGRGVTSEILIDNPTKTTVRNALVGATKAEVFKG